MFLSSLFSCVQENKQSKLFTVLNQDETGLDFNNKLKEDTYSNGFFYHYYYNGAGVAVADFNNDGLIDIYFISNLQSNKFFLNKGNLKFIETTKQSNLRGGLGFSTGVTIVDINNDGLMDIYVCKSGRVKIKEQLRNELYINQGLTDDGIPVFKEDAKRYGLDLSNNSIQASFFDFDRDGDLDMFLINHGLNLYTDKEISSLINMNSDYIGEKLFKNNNGKFIDITEEAGIISNMLGFTLGASIGDVNNDGWPDIYTGNDYSEKDHLYINNKDGTFNETSLKSFGHVSNFSMGNYIADINNDGLLDIMSLDMMASDNYTQKTSMSAMSTKRFDEHVDLGLHHQYMYNALQLNNGVDPKNQIPLFSDIALLAGVSSTDWSWSPLFFDMDNDGYKDLFVGNGIMRDFRNNDFAIYKRKKQREAYDSGVLDKDAYMADMFEKMPKREKKNHFFLNNKDLTFKNIDFKQPKSNSNGSAYADFDNDGDIDLIVNNSGGETFFYRNNSSTGSHLNIRLIGSEKNRNAIGARVEIIIGENHQILENYFSRGYQSAMAVDLHFGLGDNLMVDTLKIYWPNGKFQYKTNVSANQKITISYELKNKESSYFKKKPYLFSDITSLVGIDFKHQENIYDDFKVESLIPHKMSQLGPGLAVADVNNDGLDDFYIGGAKGQSGFLYLQTPNETFIKTITNAFEYDKNHEDTGAHFFDADNDGDQDLYVVSGGNEEPPNSQYYKDRLYINIGNGQFKNSNNAIPEMTTSGLKVISGDYDDDGDLDLFVGGRVKPMNYGQYSNSYILENRSSQGEIKFVDVTITIIPELINHTMVTDALWVDIDQDGKLDLVVANEWGSIELFKNKGDTFINVSKSFGLNTQVGWWNSIAASDIDNDGDIDLIVGNLGLNYKYKATQTEPFHLYLNDFDENKVNDIVLGYNENGKVYPLRGRECSSNQMPFIKKKFKTYDDFGKASLENVYGEKLNSGIHYSANNFASGIFKNFENQKFEFTPFENSAQISSINEILFSDFDGDQKNDLIMLGNLYESEVETPRNDASYGHFLKGNGKGEFKNIPSIQSGIYVKGNVKNASLIYLGNKKHLKKAIIIAKNDDKLTIMKTTLCCL